jgi:hypothetical protein
MTAPGDDLSGPAGAELIAAEIRTLRKGRGIQAADVDERTGPLLRELTAGGVGRGVPQDGDVATRRRVLADELTGCAVPLGPDLRLAITASLGLANPVRTLPLFRERVNWLAQQLSRDYRTALRRIGEAERRLAQEVAAELGRRRRQDDRTPDGWYLNEFRTVLRMDTPTPEAHEHRRIVATRGGLTEVMAWLDVPIDPDRPGLELAAELSYGGRLVRREQPARGRFNLVVELPAPLQPGDRHEYGLILRMPPAEPMRPHYIFTPECQCDGFQLTVQFGADCRPRWIRRVEGETVRTFDAVQTDGIGPAQAKDLLQLDDAGQVKVAFSSPTMYLGYGVQWRP